MVPNRYRKCMQKPTKNRLKAASENSIVLVLAHWQCLSQWDSQPIFEKVPKSNQKKDAKLVPKIKRCRVPFRIYKESFRIHLDSHRIYKGPYRIYKDLDRIDRYPYRIYVDPMGSKRIPIESNQSHLEKCWG